MSRFRERKAYQEELKEGENEKIELPLRGVILLIQVELNLFLHRAEKKLSEI